jgi:PAS domain S-box-containing protein
MQNIHQSDRSGRRQDPCGSGIGTPGHAGDRYRRLFNDIPVGLYITSPDGRILEANPAVVQLLGFPDKQSLLAIHASDVYVDKTDRERWLELMRRDGVVQNLELQLRRYDGRTIWVSDSAKAVCGSEGNTLYYEGTLLDVTERKTAEDAREQALSLLKATLESTADGLLVVDLNGRIVAYNFKFVQMWRIPEDVLSSGDDNSALAFVQDQLKEPEKFLGKVRELYDQPEAESFDVLEFKDGRIFERYSQPQRIGEEIVGRVWSFRDVTERHELEEQLRASQRLEAIGQLSGGVAHDFNNYLTAIHSNCELVLDDLRRGADPRPSIEEIKRAAEGAASLTRQLLAFSRRQVLQPRVLNLNQVIQQTERLLRRLIGEDIELTTKLARDLGNVKADPAQLEQVILNLAVNARDATPDGGALTMETANVELDDQYVLRRPVVKGGAYVMLTVSDTGVGFDEEIRSRIFEPFFTTKEHGHGTGLGLSTVYGIIKQSGGYIWAYSEPGQGSTFKVYLPRVEAETTTGSPSSETTAEASSGGETVLLVEDEASVRAPLRRGLERLGYRVLEASNAEAAIKVCEQRGEEIDILVTDAVMPGLNGRELAERVGSQYPELKVLFISGHGDETIARRGILEPGVAFLQKPFTPHELARKIREVLGENQA